MDRTEIFVFGSNLTGRHGAGAALAAVKEHGAIFGQGQGLQGSSYAIPTKDRNLTPLPLNLIKDWVSVFKRFAAAHPELTFNVTRIGCGLAGFTDQEIAPMFAGCPANVILPKAWGGTGFDF
jgi:hypothetical protein